MTIHIDLFTFALMYGATALLVLVSAFVGLTNKHKDEPGVSLMCAVFAALIWPIIVPIALSSDASK